MSTPRYVSIEPRRSVSSPDTRRCSTPADFVGMYDFEGTIGTGQHSVVKLATHVLSRDKVAVKVIDKSKLNKVELEHMLHEVRVMKLLRHPHVIRLYEIVETSNWFYLVLELATSGDMYEYIQKHGPLGEERAKHIFAQLVLALSYCHKHRIAHRDLKPENVVLCTDRVTGEQIVKVTDFGLSNIFSDSNMMETFCGSMAYSSPEVLLQEPYDGPMSDIWSLGVILFMMVCKKHPFRQVNEHETLVKVMDVAYSFPENVSKNFCDLIDSILKKDPKDRCTLEQIKDHPWLQTGNGDSLVDEWTERDHRRTATGQSLSLKADIGIGGRISKADHDRIVREMEKSDITREQIDAALSEESYNYISSTYYLMAEQALVKQSAPSESNYDSLAFKASSVGDTLDFFSPPPPDDGSGLHITPTRSNSRGEQGNLRQSLSCGRPLRQRARRPSGNLSKSFSAQGSLPMSQAMESLALSPRPMLNHPEQLRQSSAQDFLENHHGGDDETNDAIEAALTTIQDESTGGSQEMVSPWASDGIETDPFPNDDNDVDDLNEILERETSDMNVDESHVSSSNSPLSQSGRFSDLPQLDELAEESEPEEDLSFY